MMKRVVSLLLLLSLCVCYLTSCGENFAATTTMAKAEKGENAKITLIPNGISVMVKA